MISFFHTPKPKQFKYRPRFYDPEREEFEELRKKYEMQSSPVDDETLDYYKRKIRSFEKDKDIKPKSFFRKKTVHKFNYQPRFYSPEQENQKVSDTKIEFKPMFGEEKEFAERIPIGRILVTITIIILLLLWIFF